MQETAHIQYEAFPLPSSLPFPSPCSSLHQYLCGHGAWWTTVHPAGSAALHLDQDKAHFSYHTGRILLEFICNNLGPSLWSCYLEKVCCIWAWLWLPWIFLCFTASSKMHLFGSYLSHQSQILIRHKHGEAASFRLRLWCRQRSVHVSVPLVLVLPADCAVAAWAFLVLWHISGGWRFITHDKKSGWAGEGAGVGEGVMRGRTQMVINVECKAVGSVKKRKGATGIGNWKFWRLLQKWLL